MSCVKMASPAITRQASAGKYVGSVKSDQRHRLTAEALKVNMTAP